jgi:hypothetical protein
MHSSARKSRHKFSSPMWTLIHLSIFHYHEISNNYERNSLHIIVLMLFVSFFSAILLPFEILYSVNVEPLGVKT